jgi:cation diffusion facilitator CzcD-associated flavoprotein CzcO
VETTDIDCITADGVKMADGTEHKLDLLILATGFFFNVQNVKQVSGINGISLADYWKDGIKTYRSITVPGFPNYFMLIGPNSPVTNLSLIEIAEIGVDYVMQCVQKIRTNEVTSLVPTLEATNVYMENLCSAFGDTIWTSGCSSWYLDDDGIPGTYPGPPSQYRVELSKPDLSEYNVIGA